MEKARNDKYKPYQTEEPRVTSTRLINQRKLGMISTSLIKRRMLGMISTSPIKPESEE